MGLSDLIKPYKAISTNYSPDQKIGSFFIIKKIKKKCIKNIWENNEAKNC